MAELIAYAIAFGFTGLLVYVLMRYGPVEHGWVCINPDEEKELKRLNAKHKAGYALGKVLPAGKPIYKRKMVSHNGIVIHSNGLIAKFCIAKKGKYRFVPFSRITGIYPAIMHNPLATKDSTLMGLASWKELQIETDDFMVYLIDSRSHDFEVLIPVMKNAMGSLWDTVYKPNEVIEGTPPQGNFYRHRHLRGEPAQESAITESRIGSPNQAVEFGTPMAKLKPLEGYGTLLAQESERDIEERRKAMLKGATIMFIVGGALLAFGLLTSNMLSMLSIFISLLFGCLMIMLGLAFFNASKKTEPMQIYENGILQPYILGKDKQFIPYGRIVSISETKNVIDGELIVLKTLDNQTIGFRKNSPEVMAQLDMIRSKTNNPNYDFNIQEVTAPAMGGKMALLAYLLAPALALMVSVFMTYSAFGAGRGAITYAMGLVLLWPGITFLLLSFVLLRFRKNARIFGKGPGLKVPMAIVISLLILFIAGEAVLLNISIPGQAGTYEIFPAIEPMPVASVLNGTFYENSDIQINGTVFVGSGQTLLIRNSTLNLGGVLHKDASIWTAPGSELILDNCTLRSVSPSASYSFEVFGTFVMDNCRVSGVWGDIDNVNMDGGIEIYSPDARIFNSTIFSPTTNGIMAINSSLTMENTRIINAFDDAIEARNSTVRLNNCTISESGWAMVIEQGSNVTMIGCNIRDNSNGVAAMNSALTVHNCEFTGNSIYAIQYRNMEYIDIGENTLAPNDAVIEVSGGSEYLLLCNAITIIMAIVCMLTIIYCHKATDNQ